MDDRHEMDRSKYVVPKMHLWDIPVPSNQECKDRWQRWNDASRGIPLNPVHPPLPEWATIIDCGSWT